MFGLTSPTPPRTSIWLLNASQWSKSADAQQQSQTLAGLHADYTMFVIDEAGSVPRAVAVTAQAALATGRECKFIIDGNPTSLDGPLYHAAVTHRPRWHVVTVTGDPDDRKRSFRVSLEWAREQIASYGRSNPWVRVNVLGLFPEASLNALLGVDEVTAAMERHLREDAYTWAQKRVGIDPSRFGGDRTVLFPRQGLAAFRPIILRPARQSALSVDVANQVLTVKARWGSELEFIYSTGGWGAGITDVSARERRGTGGRAVCGTGDGSAVPQSTRGMLDARRGVGPAWGRAAECAGARARVDGNDVYVCRGQVSARGQGSGEGPARILAGPRRGARDDVRARRVAEGHDDGTRCRPRGPRL
jgi:hypothetical protein